MTALLIVSHSRRLAEGVRELAENMAQGRATILTAAGVSADPDALGTDAVMILEALSAIDADEDIIVFMDQGSALISAEMALELVEPDVAARVHLSAAPLVEGVTAAATAAAAGLPVAAVLAEANGSLAAKREQLGDRAAGETVIAAAPATAAGDALTAEWTVANPHGLHARPCARIVAAFAGLSGSFSLSSGGSSADAISIGQLARLGVRKGDLIRFAASGPDAAVAVARFETLAQAHFGDDLSEPAVAATLAPVPAALAGAVAGIAASAGIGIGIVRRIGSAPLQFDDRPSAGPQVERDRLSAALGRALAALDRLAEDTRRRIGAAEADIFEAHRQILADPALRAALDARLDDGASAEAAFAAEMAELEAVYAGATDDYARARAGDARDLALRVLGELGARPADQLILSEPCVLVADDLGPSETASLDPAMVTGLCLAGGGRTSHSAILARALGIPAVVGLGAGAQAITEGRMVIVDGGAGQVLIDFDDDTRRACEARRDQLAAERVRVCAEARAPAVTEDGAVIEVFANIGGPGDVAAAVAAGAEGVGLMRSEFLFMDRPDLPSEDEQAEAFSRTAAALGGRPLIIRTLDVGGDKPVPMLQQVAEDNPFLGCRGARLALKRPEVFGTHLRAILRAAAAHPGLVRVMFPMLSTLDEWQALDGRLEAERARLLAGGLPVERPKVGVMIEVPAAVLIADRLAAAVDFFSIGTNDLTQYVMAADRGNAAVSDLVDPLQPAVLAAIAATCRAGKAAGIPVGMCGEMAGDPALAALLIGLGLTELSMSAAAIPAVKAALRSSRRDLSLSLATAACAAGSVADVRRSLAP